MGAVTRSFLLVFERDVTVEKINDFLPRSVLSPALATFFRVLKGCFSAILLSVSVSSLSLGVNYPGHYTPLSGIAGPPSLSPSNKVSRAEKHIADERAFRDIRFGENARAYSRGAHRETNGKDIVRESAGQLASSPTKFHV